MLGKAFVQFIQFCTKDLLQDKICFSNWNETANQSIEMSGKEAAKEKKCPLLKTFHRDDLS